MVRRWFLVSLLLILCAAGLPALSSSTAAAPPVTATDNAVPDVPAAPLGDFMGMVIRDPQREWGTDPSKPDAVNTKFFDTMGQELEDAGVRWVRFEFYAEDGIPYDPAKPLQGLKLEKYDYFINVVAPRHDLKILALLSTNLVRNPGYRDPEELDLPIANFPDDSCATTYKYSCGTNLYMRIWLDRAFAIAEHYEDKIAAYEVMNEINRYINSNNECRPDSGGKDCGARGIEPERMAQLMTKFYRVFKDRGGPDGTFGAWRYNVKLIFGGLHPHVCNDCRNWKELTDRQYLAAVYASTAFQNYRSPAGKPYKRFPLDGVSYHPYPLEIHNDVIYEPTGVNDLYRIPRRIQALRTIMHQAGDSTGKLWITEVGDRGAPQLDTPSGDLSGGSELRQANFMRSMYWLLWLNRDFVENVFWFKYEDFGLIWEGNEVWENWGIVRLHTRPGYPQAGDDSQYVVSGSVERRKLSYDTYKTIAEQGFNLYRTHLPIMSR